MVEKKVAYVGRHRLLSLQERALSELGFSIVKTVENLPTDPRELNTLLDQLKEEGIEAIITVALPPNLLAMLSSKFPLYVFEMRSTTFSSLEDAERWASEKPEARTYLSGRAGEPIRAMEFMGINKVKVTITSEKVYEVS